MPAFSFEKIAPPVDVASVSNPQAEKKQGVIVQILGRIAEGRGKRRLKSGRTVESPKSEPKS